MSDSFACACGRAHNSVIDSRWNAAQGCVMRRRECILCGHRFTTYEYTKEAIGPMRNAFRILENIKKAMRS